MNLHISLRRRLTIYLIVLHVIFFALGIALYHDKPLMVVAVEALLLLSMIGGVYLLSKTLQPLDYAQRFHDLLQDRNYAARLQQISGDELSPLVNLFNTQLAALYEERIKLGEQRGFLDRLLEATPSAVIVFDFDARISLLNASAQQLLGLDHAEGRQLSEWRAGTVSFAAGLDEAARTRCLSLLQQLDVLPLAEVKLLTDSDGRRYRCQRNQFFDRGFARHFLLIEELTHELESSEKATYEKLVRVLAHEVNNTVAATGSVLDSLLFYRAQIADSDASDFTTAIEAVKRRNASLGEFIERFTRVVKMPEALRRPTNLQDMLEQLLRLYREPCRSHGIILEWRRCDSVPVQMLDSNLMEQALLNIVKNAMEAALSSCQETGRSNGAVYLELAQEEQRVRLSIIDTGNRLSEVPSGQLFTPFFTTKKGGQGIGLLFVREVLNRHELPYRLAPSGTGETRFDIWFSQP